MEETQPSEMLVFYDITTWCHNPEYHDLKVKDETYEQTCTPVGLNNAEPIADVMSH